MWHLQIWEKTMTNNTLQEQIENYINFNCKFCKNVSSCEFYPFLVTPGAIVKWDITRGDYACANREKDHGARIVRIEKVS